MSTTISKAQTVFVLFGTAMAGVLAGLLLIMAIIGAIFWAAANEDAKQRKERLQWGQTGTSHVTPAPAQPTGKTSVKD